MHNTINYGSTDTIIKRRQAVLDAIEWLGYKRTRIIIKNVLGEKADTVHFYFSFAGISGYPVYAFSNWFGHALQQPELLA